jgi:hypothetical protein
MLLVASSSPPVFMQVGPTKEDAPNVKEPPFDYNEPPFDFSDEFYRQNGINPAQIKRRPGNPDRVSDHFVEDYSYTDSTRRGYRLKETTGGWDKDGNLIYYSIMGDVIPATFTSDAAGVRARRLAEDFRAFLFPKTPRNADGSPGRVVLDPAPPNRRQDNVFDTKNEYFCQNLLGLWIVTFVVYTQRAYNALFRDTDPLARQLLESIARRNGTDLDGTPILQRLAEIESLKDQGLVELRQNPEAGPPGGADGPRWVI